MESPILCPIFDSIPWFHLLFHRTTPLKPVWIISPLQASSSTAGTRWPARFPSTTVFWSKVGCSSWIWGGARSPATSWDLDFAGIPSGYVKIAIENHHRNHGFSMIFSLNMVIFNSYVSHYQRVSWGYHGDIMGISGMKHRSSSVDQ